MKDLSSEFKHMFERIALVRTNFVKAVPVIMNTMTFSGRFNRGDIPIKAIRSEMAASNIIIGDDDISVSLATPKIVKRRNISSKSAHMNKFDHQVSFNIGTSCVKLFFNGSIHGTGFCSSNEFIAAAEIIANIIQRVCGIETELVEINTNLINVSTAVFDSSWKPLKFNLKKLSEAFMRNNVHADFNPEQHPACKVVLFEKEKKLITGLIFPTGSISIFGSKEPKYIADIYETILKTMDDNVHMSVLCDFRKTTLKKHFSVSHGYPQSSVTIVECN